MTDLQIIFYNELLQKKTTLEITKTQNITLKKHNQSLLKQKTDQNIVLSKDECYKLRNYNKQITAINREVRQNIKNIKTQIKTARSDIQNTIREKLSDIKQMRQQKRGNSAQIKSELDAQILNTKLMIQNIRTSIKQIRKPRTIAPSNTIQSEPIDISSYMRSQDETPNYKTFEYKKQILVHYISIVQDVNYRMINLLDFRTRDKPVQEEILQILNTHNIPYIITNNDNRLHFMPKFNKQFMDAVYNHEEFGYIIQQSIIDFILSNNDQKKQRFFPINFQASSADIYKAVLSKQFRDKYCKVDFEKWFYYGMHIWNVRGTKDISWFTSQQREIVV